MDDAVDDTHNAGRGYEDDLTIEFYWRPGCGFCGRLYRDLQELGIEVADHHVRMGRKVSPC